MSSLEHLSLIRTPNGIRSYAVVLPRPMPSDFLIYVARIAAGIPELSRPDIHFMAVADSGVPLAVATIMERARRNNRRCDDLLTVIEPGRPEYLPQELDSRRQHVIVDNSVKSMATINMVHHRLTASKVNGSILLKLIDYEDQIESEQQEIIDGDLGLRVISLFRFSDVLGEIPGGKESIVQWLLHPSSGKA